MENPQPERKGCDPQLFAPDIPSSDWDSDRLHDFVRRQHRLIISGEKSLAPAYWRLGAALVQARRRCGRGEWASYLAELEIEKSRASKARAIYRTFDTLERLADLTVDEAYASRRSESTKPAAEIPAETEVPVADELASTLEEVHEQATRLCDATTDVTHGELQNILGTVRRTIDRLQRIEQDLRRALDAREQA